MALGLTNLKHLGTARIGSGINPRFAHFLDFFDVKATESTTAVFSGDVLTVDGAITTVADSNAARA